MAENTTSSTEKVVTLESLEALREIIPTNEEVDAKIAEAVTTCANITFASAEEVLALFKKKPETTPETPEDNG